MSSGSNNRDTGHLIKPHLPFYVRPQSHFFAVESDEAAGWRGEGWCTPLLLSFSPCFYTYGKVRKAETANSFPIRRSYW